VSDRAPRMRQYAGIAGIVMLALTTVVWRPRFVPADLPADPAGTLSFDRHRASVQEKDIDLGERAVSPPYPPATFRHRAHDRFARAISAMRFRGSWLAPQAGLAGLVTIGAAFIVNALVTDYATWGAASYRWVQRFTSEFIEAARLCRHALGDRWFADETYF
jgi:hypothetical protein